jgi:hypothetical protein
LLLAFTRRALALPVANISASAPGVSATPAPNREVIITNGHPCDHGDSCDELIRELSGSKGWTTTYSTCSYTISDDGMVERGIWIDIMQRVKAIGLKAMPLFYEDCSHKDSCDLDKKLMAAFARQDDFIAQTVQEALQFGFDGYYLDFEFAHQEVNPDRLSSFVLAWGRALNQHGLELSIWTSERYGLVAHYDMPKLLNPASSIASVSTMDTYSLSGIDSFKKHVDSADCDKKHPHKCGLGMYDYTLSADELMQAARYAKKKGIKSFNFYPPTLLNADERDAMTCFLSKDEC